jgi:phosphatidate cytidylyltransferase
MFSMLRQRLQSGIIMGAALIAAAYWLPVSAVVVVFLAVCIVGLWEFYAFLDAAHIPHFKFIGLFGGVALILTTALCMRHGVAGDAELSVLSALTALIFLRQFPQKNNPRPLDTIAGTLMGILYVPFLFNFFTKLFLAWGDHTGRLLVMYLIVVVKFTDIGAYFVGCAFGRHKLIPRISPAKTWEGCLGGAFTGVAASVVFYLCAGHHFTGLNLQLRDAIVLGLILATVGTVGDLTESLFKRAAGVKDSGHLILGMGGLLDVLDSLLFAAPALYVYARFLL